MDSPRPFFSLITATYNAARDIESLAESILSQEFTDYEWCVQDGNSPDDTVAIVLGSGVTKLDCVSESDEGIYDALNKVQRRARGHYFIFLGSDDRLSSPEVLGQLAKELRAAKCSPIALLASIASLDGKRFRSRIGRQTLVTNTVHHQGAVYSREIFESFEYRLDIPIVADYGLTLSLIPKQSRLVYSETVMAICGHEGISNTSSELTNYLDMHKMRRELVGHGESLVYLLAGLANVLRRRLMPR